MIIQEILEGMNLVKTYSDQNLMMLQVETGAMYGEAIDIMPCPFTYEETDIPIDQDEEENDEETNGEVLDEE